MATSGYELRGAIFGSECRPEGEREVQKYIGSELDVNKSSDRKWPEVLIHF